jgi:arginine utilization protein RocB
MHDWEELGRRVIALAQRLVATPSVVDTAGEAEVADLLAAHLREQSAGLPGVEVRVADVPKATPCRAVLAYAPASVETRQALVLLGHFDTVGIEPYGPLAPHAFDSAALKAAYATRAPRRASAKAGAGKAGADADALAAAAASPDWAFGRGWLDMKGGVAAITEVFLAEAGRRELPAHLILLLTPDEESASLGLRALIPELLRLKQEHKLEFRRIVNADYTAPLFAGDEARYLYSGTVGKLLLGLSIFGRTTHVGETFAGLSASALAGYLAFALEHNRKLLAGVAGEWLPPPTVLHLGDRRERYDVMTLDYAEVYANVFHAGGRPETLWSGILSELRRLARRYDRELRLRYNRFCARANLRPPRCAERVEVIDYAALLKCAAQAAGKDTAGLLDALKAEAAGRFADARERALHVVRRLHAHLPPGRPMLVAALLPPFYPAQVQRGSAAAGMDLAAFCAVHGLKHRRIYPYIADLSYFAFGKESLGLWQRQSPLWFAPGEVEQYQAAAAPVLNLGPWGCGAHSAHERVHLPYLRDTLPRLLCALLYELAR